MEMNMQKEKLRLQFNQVFLKCLPADINKWSDSIKILRSEYDEIKKVHITNPRLEAEQKDLQLDNPLSQSDESSWQKYFKNNELMAMINRDVKRTFPEMEYFHNSNVREMLVNVLFCYAREHEDLSYRQGMHELLGPLVFIIHCDLQAACHASEIGEIYDVMKEILDVNFLEHDSYAMFCQLMKATNSWYAVTSQPVTTNNENVDETKRLFKTPKDSVNGPTLAITNKLNHIHNTLLSQHDIELYTYLNRLEIIPQVYGLRWIRLLFGREFSLQDLLVLWDAIFADSHSLDLVDYIFVAMLMHIRNILLEEDYSTCMQRLMKFPPIEDINDLVSTAKLIREKKVGSIKGIVSKPIKSQIKKSPKQNQNKFSKFFSDISKQMNDISLPRKTVLKTPTASSLMDPTHANNGKVNSFYYPTEVQNETSQSQPSQLENNVPLTLENHILKLQQDLENAKLMCSYCSDKIDSSVRVLESNMKNESENQSKKKAEGDTNTVNQASQTLVAIASLKQVRDILRGSLNFSFGLKPATKASDPNKEVLTAKNNNSISKSRNIEMSSVSESDALNHSNVTT